MTCTKCPYKLSCLIIQGQQGRRLKRIYSECYKIVQEVFRHKKADCAYWCAVHDIRGRWPEAENIIKQDPFRAYTYARDVIKGRWPEAEDLIRQSPCWEFYCRVILQKSK